MVKKKSTAPRFLNPLLDVSVEIGRKQLFLVFKWSAWLALYLIQANYFLHNLKPPKTAISTVL